MNTQVDYYLFGCGIAAILGALLHLAMPFGGPAWFTYFGAPDRLARMAGAGHWYPTFTCVVIATLLFICAGYAFSGAGAIGPWPLLPFALRGIGAVLVLRGLLFIPLVYFWPESLASVTNCRSVNGFLITTSLICTAAGAGYLAALRQLLR